MGRPFVPGTATPLSAEVTLLDCSRIKTGAGSLIRTLRDNPILAAFIVLALASRLTFWFYTGRVWEDALITITAARNVWEGFGLTHHASEPYVQSFTSPISVLIPIVGEAFNAGLLALRLSSLAASVATIYFAYRIGVLLAFRWVAHVLVLTFLACDQLHIFFGMGGMETQVVTAVALATLYFYLASRWWALGFACGFATLSRPEFVMFLLPPIGLAVLIFHRRALHKVAIPALAVALPWYLFATLYYGSPVPNTIVAKSWSYQIGMFSASWEEIWNFTLRSWRDYAPFKEFWVSYEAPLPDIVLKAIVALVLVLVLGGVVVAAKRKPALAHRSGGGDRFRRLPEFDHHEFVLHVVPPAVHGLAFYPGRLWLVRASRQGLVAGRRPGNDSGLRLCASHAVFDAVG